MKGAGTAVLAFVGIAAIGIVLALLVGAAARDAAPVPDTGEILSGAGELVEAVASNNVEFIRQVYIWSTWSNGVYLLQSAPYTVMAVAGAILALGLGLVLVAITGGGRHGV